MLHTGGRINLSKRLGGRTSLSSESGRMWEQLVVPRHLIRAPLPSEMETYSSITHSLTQSLT